jgi:hypothetical protein
VVHHPIEGDDTPRTRKESPRGTCGVRDRDGGFLSPIGGCQERRGSPKSFSLGSLPWTRKVHHDAFWQAHLMSAVGPKSRHRPDGSAGR